MQLLHNPVFLLIFIVILGEALGRVRIGTFSFGSSAIIFVALLFGHFGYILPGTFQSLGLALFIYAIGLQAGPGFISSFRSYGLHLTLCALALVFTGFAAALLCSWSFGFDAGTAAGLFAGAMTSTPGLAVAVESAGGGNAPAAYGLTYTVGVVGVILFLKLLPRLLKVDIAGEEQALAEELARNYPPVTFHHIEVTNPNLFDKRVDQIFLKEVAPVTITRLLRAGAAEPILVSGDTVMREGDHLRIAGREQDLEKAELYMGRRIAAEIEFNRVFAKKSIVVSKQEAVGQTLAAMNFREVYNVQVSRITRNGIDLPAEPNYHLHLGDVLHVVGDERSLFNVTRLLGNDIKATYSINILSIFIGLLLGFLLGQLPLALPFAGRFTLGTTGGVLIAGLVLSRLYSTGPFIWEIPSTGNNFIRDLGLMLFLATVGTAAGATIIETLATQGLTLLLAGALVTMIPLILCALLGARILRIPFLRLLGVLAGGMTSTPGLAATSSLSDTPYAAGAYATVYPVALIGMIVFAKGIVLILG